MGGYFLENFAFNFKQLLKTVIDQLTTSVHPVGARRRILCLNTVMIRFTDRGAYLLFGTQGRALIRDRVRGAVQDRYQF